jgi:7-cyano-7-deazaguanine synthase in queuosine biosynthesis
MKRFPALVLFSGLDSAAALHWARSYFDPVVALGIAYGQPRAELAAAQAIAERRGVYAGVLSLSLPRDPPQPPSRLVRPPS